MDWSIFLDPTVLFDLVLQGIVRGSMYALMGVGLSLIFGIVGVVNFAHGELFMLGSYGIYFLVSVLGMPYPLALLVTISCVFFIGLMIEYGLIAPLRRRSGRHWQLDSFVLTIGFGMILQNLALLVFSSERRGMPEIMSGELELGNIFVSYERLFIIVACAFIILGLNLFIRYSNTGRAIRAVAQNSDAAQTLGINSPSIYAIAFGIGAGLAGAAGAILISVYPAYPEVGTVPGLKAFAVVILGGLGSIPGAIACGLILGVIESFSFFTLSAGWQDVLTTMLLVAGLIWRPNGLFTPKGLRA